MWSSASTLPGVRRIAGIVLAVLLIGGVVAAVVAGRQGDDKGTATKTVRGVIGSEKADFFADPDVVKALAAKGFTVKTETSGSWAMDGLNLKGDDFAFPSSQAPADALGSVSACANCATSATSLIRSGIWSGAARSVLGMSAVSSRSSSGFRSSSSSMKLATSTFEYCSSLIA